jgi:putative transposase
MSLWPKKCAARRHVVVSVKTHLKTPQSAHVGRFSRDCTWGYDRLIDSDRLRFHLECTFRDAKQYWGLEDFMKVNARPVYQGANLALFMGHVSHAWMRPMRAPWSACSVHDRKAGWRGQTYVVETFTWLPESLEPSFIDPVVSKMAELGRVNHAVNSV